MSPELPSGTVTFLFTDIERSTETVAALGDERYADVQEEHRRLLREAFAAHDGVEVGTEGDAFFVAFARAGDAVAAAVDGQRALDGHSLRVRMGLHTGEALVRDASYVGHDVHKAKRVSDAGHGGQILLSQATAELVRDACDLIDLGPHRLKDLGEAQRLYQVVGDGLPSEFPPLRSLDAFTHNLPLQRSLFVGREEEIAQVRKQLDLHRLVTLTGVGGCGKTRLALQVGAEQLDYYPDGVFFADLAPLADPDLVARTVATAVGAPPGATVAGGVGPAADELLLDYLARRTCLVILDNCEHLLDECADLVDRILGRCPDVVVLATSREGLDVEGEQSWRVPSLSLPADAAGAQESEAVSLFKARAQAVKPDFDLTPSNVGAVTEICRRLDGIPLAIEFAASRVSHMSPQEIADRLGDMFRLLVGGRRRAQRQQTLQAALDWSYELLSDTERVLLPRLAAFSGSFMLKAAEGICGDDLVPARDVLDLLGSLVTKSLVVTEEHEGETRYRLLETVRLYAAEKLREAGEADAFRSRHRDWYLAWLRSFSWEDLYLSSPTGVLIEADLPNLRAALEWSTAEGRPDLVAAMAARLYAAWCWLGHYEEGFRVLMATPPEDLDIDPEERVACLGAAAMCSGSLLRGEGPDLRRRAVAAAQGRPSGPFVDSLCGLALNRSVVAETTGDAAEAEAVRELFDEAHRVARTLATVWVGHTALTAGAAEVTMRDLEKGKEHLTQAVAHFDESNNAGMLTVANTYRAVLGHIVGDHALAVEAADWLLERGRALGGWHSGIATAAGVAFAGAGQRDRARDALRDNVDEVRRSGMPGTLEELLTGFAALATIEGDHERASRLLWWVRARVFEAGRISRSPVAYALYVHYVRLVRDKLPHEQAASAREIGRAMSEDQAVAYALEGLRA